MRKLVLFGLFAAVICLATSPAFAVPIFPNVPNTFSGPGVGADAGWMGAAAGTQAALFSWSGSEVSLDLTGGVGGEIVNLPQASPAAIGAALGFINPVTGAGIPVPTPAGFILEANSVTDGSTISFGQELTAIVGGLWPTSLTPFYPPAAIPGAVLDNGVAPGSTAGDGIPDQLLQPGAVGLPVIGGTGTGYSVGFGPGDPNGPAFFPFPVPVFEIYDDVPTTLDANISTSGNLAEEHMDFDGVAAGGPPFVGPTLPPPTGSPSQFINTADEGTVPGPNQVRNASNGVLFAAGFIEVASVTYHFFDPTVIGSGALGTGPGGDNGGYVYRVEFTGKGVVTDGSILDIGLLPPDPTDLAFDGSPINITFSGTLFGEAFDGALFGGMDPFGTWDLRRANAGNSGDSSNTMIPVPEPATLTLFGLGLAGLAGVRKKRRKA